VHLSICGGDGGSGGGRELCTEGTGAVYLVSLHCTAYMNWHKIRSDEILL
jgi:hypothetical protein